MTRLDKPGPLLAVEGLSVRFDTRRQCQRVIDDISFTVERGETVCIVGESGSGKTLTALSLMSLLPPGMSVAAGALRFNGQDLLALDAGRRAMLYGDRIAMIFQDPMSSLNPVLTIGRQITESLARHQPSLTRRERELRAEQALSLAGIPDAGEKMRRYPHELSGGLCQRSLIAIALVNQPRLIIADEPTTALDVTVQAQVMNSMRAACRQTGAALLLITHDMGLVAQHADRVVVMYAGRIVEQGRAGQVFRSSRHPYTRALLSAIPRLDSDVDRELEVIAGEPPLFSRLPSGCAFRPRCRLCRDRPVCAATIPPPRVEQGDPLHVSACHFAHELAVPTRMERK
ncbi:ABC transporter ATP-binding protein [Acerihabitans arboris]|uniref:ABC-type dipeptide transporter n=1 Tax=Acerihabitans arboris TaxID=2691583 RepID=A0A845SF31_9GAMM|nr:ABC transporter ATP-binding protein [Acerihabitans arboris]NDL61696.1 ATP-binding cassette domain-containing protein [Acerihabitans arboris]